MMDEPITSKPVDDNEKHEAIRKLLERDDLTELERQQLKEGKINLDAVAVERNPERDALLEQLGVEQSTPVSETLGADTVAESDVTEQKQEVKPCPCCGWRDINVEPYPVTDDDKRNWIRSVTGNTTFKREIEIFNGQEKISFQTPPQRIRNLVSTQVYDDVASSDVSGDLPTTIMAQVSRALRLGMASAIRSLPHRKSVMLPDIPMKINDIYDVLVDCGAIDGTEEDREVFNDCKKRYKNPVVVWHDMLFYNVNSALYGALVNAYVAFEQLVARVDKAAISPDFYRGIGLPV